MRWTPQQAWSWYNHLPWLCGFNYLPRTAVNSLEMWQAETFDPKTISQELGWAQDIGFNACRIYLPFLLWRHDPQGLAARLDQFLDIAAAHGLSSMIVLFDDCDSVGRSPVLGEQGCPVPGVHNSRWTPSPGHRQVVDRALQPILEEYVTSVVACFGQDERVLLWDIYNEPGQSGMGAKSLPLLREAFVWARSARPSQPLTAAIYSGPPPNLPLEASLEASSPRAAEAILLAQTMLAESDVLSFHDYLDAAHLEHQIAALKPFGRPLLCTEWLCRPLDSRVETHLPVLAQERVGCFFWGLVNGRTQTQYPWQSPPGAAEPDLWFHDLLRDDGKPYLEEEVSAFQKQLQPTNPYGGNHKDNE